VLSLNKSVQNWNTSGVSW